SDLADGEPPQVEAEHPHHHDGEPGVEDGLQEHAAQDEGLLGAATPAPRDQLAALEAEPEGEDGGGEEQDDGPRQVLPDDGGDVGGVTAEADAHLAAEEIGDVGDVLDVERLVEPETQDRKSTRLNSSHVKISYAV